MCFGTRARSDFALKTDPARYKQYFLSFADTLRANAVDAPVFISTATRCLTGWTQSNAIRTAQQELASSQPGLKPGVDTDKLLSAQDRYDDCHMAEFGRGEKRASVGRDPRATSLTAPKLQKER